MSSQLMYQEGPTILELASNVTKILENLEIAISRTDVIGKQVILHLLPDCTQALQLEKTSLVQETTLGIFM
jgi:hypothetical protein